MTKFSEVSSLTDAQVQKCWEEAYERFETPEEEIRKFINRLNRLGQINWVRNQQIVDIFSGRCNGIRALEELGFTNLEGIDISPNLLSNYQGKAKLYVADCRDLPLEDKSRDIIIVQGGLHHLPNLPEGLEKTFSEIARVLRSDGKFIMIEPWETRFLNMIHFLSKFSLVKLTSPKFDALATMIHYEANTYFNWLSRKEEILVLLSKYFTEEYIHIGWGKINFIGKNK